MIFDCLGIIHSVVPVELLLHIILLVSISAKTVLTRWEACRIVCSLETLVFICRDLSLELEILQELSLCPTCNLEHHTVCLLCRLSKMMSRVGVLGSSRTERVVLTCRRSKWRQINSRVIIRCSSDRCKVVILPTVREIKSCTQGQPFEWRCRGIEVDIEPLLSTLSDNTLIVDIAYRQEIFCGTGKTIQRKDMSLIWSGSGYIVNPVCCLGSHRIWIIVGTL